MKWSAYQNNIFDAIQNTDKNILVKATAGAGKSTTIIHALSLIPKLKKSVFLSFSNFIVNELKERIPTNVKASTLHSLGCRMIMDHYKGIKVHENKYFNLALKGVKKSEFTKETYRNCYNIQDISSFIRMTLTNLDFDSVVDMCSYYGIDWEEDNINKAIQLIEEDYRPKQIDFADMLYLPATQPEIINEVYDYVFLDEAQDINNSQFKFVENLKKTNGRIISVGDERQCQPAGTKIQMADRSLKNIEDIKLNDFVTSYVASEGRFTYYYKHDWTYSANEKTTKGGRITDIQERKYTGKLYEIELENGLKTKYTDNHICCYKFNKDIINSTKYLIYLMQKGDQFRIGITKFWKVNSREGQFGLGQRALGERADYAWILKTFDTREEALIYEQVYSYQFGIPQFIFQDPQIKGQVITNQCIINKFWKLVDKEELYNKVIKTLNFFDKDIRYPFYKKNKEGELKNSRMSTNLMFYTEACNLMPELMDMSVFIPNSRGTADRTKGYPIHNWEKISKIIETKVQDLPVYSMNVSYTKLYIGDGILTHNCIYGFAGNDINTFKKLETMPNTMSLPLSVNYRCGKNIVNEARKVYTDIIAHENSIEGVVKIGDIEEVTEGDMVLCRNNAPLVSVYFYLIGKGIKAHLVGKDLEKGILELAKSVLSTNREKIITSLAKKLEKIEKDLVKLNMTKPKNHPRYITMREKVDIVLFILTKIQNPQNLVKKIEEIFDDKKEGCKLLTIHRAKGSESDKVFLVRTYNGEKLIPSKYARKEWEKIQENNLLFVALTRAKKELVYLDYEDEEE